ncbi:hypothetical protein [Methanimicrococcus hacksteinii]|uniref:hypothetical protein n=1 Tax=Methanimicrococcus hacksteinii TaxID=3028293 RepID=UPI00298F229F|nr:hypothetical protein [Methanimicrococcus sp. At1]
MLLSANANCSLTTVLPLGIVLPYVSSHSYHIRSLRERGHRLPYRFRLHCYLTVSVCAATLPFPFALLPYRFCCRCYLTVSVCTATLPFPFAAATLPVPLCCCRRFRLLLSYFNTVADLPACLPPPFARDPLQFQKIIEKTNLVS